MGYQMDSDFCLTSCKIVIDFTENIDILKIKKLKYEASFNSFHKFLSIYKTIKIFYK
jgi:hypothetical protein